MAPRLNWKQRESSARVNHSWLMLNITTTLHPSAKVADEIEFRLANFIGFTGNRNLALVRTSWEDDDAFYAWFEMLGIPGFLSRIPNGNRVPVRLWCDKLGWMLCGDTAGRHMLIGQRRWTVEKLDNQTLKVSTEAYERPRGSINAFGMRLIGKSMQQEIWEAYFSNLANHLTHEFNCSIRMIQGPVVTVNGNLWSPCIPYPHRGGF